MHLKMSPVFLTVIFAGLSWGLCALWPSMVVELPFGKIIATLLILAGLLTAGTGFMTFFKLETTVNPFKPGNASSLVSTGIYRYSRNPMYLGFLMMLVGWAVYLSHIPGLILVPSLYVIYINKFQIIPEEQVLEELFGEGFVDYKNKVRRWI